MNFENIRTVNERAYAFTLSPIHVTYANTIRRLILTGVETVAFRSDMTATGSTTDVVVKRNDTPMTNEMLADRIGLLPINITDPLTWKSDKYVFTLNVAGDKDNTTYVRSSDFKVKEIVSIDSGAEVEPASVPTEKFFPPNTITGDTCLIATLQPGSNTLQQFVEIEAKATKGTGREHARFIPVSQCSYEYTPDSNPQRVEEMFVKWLDVAKKASAVEKGSERYNELRREFNTMQIKRCYKVNEKNEPFSFDFTVETAGVLSVPYIIKRACEVGENMCSRYVNIHRGELPDEITISAADTRIIGFDFLIRGHDHTLGNLIQTWLVENHIQGEAKPKITYAGYSVPHPLRDEIILRIGVEDGEEATARLALAEAAKGCVDMFQKLRLAWQAATGAPPAPSIAVRRNRPKVAQVTKVG
jgi:DNA-directed RNA polymerase subunit L/DNA-directed RNA polymerase alpha subunit